MLSLKITMCLISRDLSSYFQADDLLNFPRQKDNKMNRKCFQQQRSKIQMFLTGILNGDKKILLFICIKQKVYTIYKQMCNIKISWG